MSRPVTEAEYMDIGDLARTRVVVGLIRDSYVNRISETPPEIQAAIKRVQFDTAVLRDYLEERVGQHMHPDEEVDPTDHPWREWLKERGGRSS